VETTNKIQERIGRLKEKRGHGIARHYKIDMVLDENKEKVVSLTWEKIPVEGTQLTHPGVGLPVRNETLRCLGISASPGGIQKLVI